MDDFAKRAFQDAVKAESDAEFDGFRREVIGHSDQVLTTAAILAGMEDMDDLARIISENGHKETFARFVNELLTIGYHIGYKEGRLAQ